MGILRKLVIELCSWIYPLIPPLYGIFYDLARNKFFGEGVIKQLSTNIYILVSVVMLFAFGIQILKSIVNPDSLFDSKKGTISVVKRSIIAIALIVLLPWMFDMLYSVQDQIIKNSLIEKVIVGMTTTTTDEKSNNSGQVLAASILVDLLYPKEGATTSVGTALQTSYNKMITEDISEIDYVKDYINEKYSPSGDDDDEDSNEYVFEFQPLVAIIVGGFTLYMLILFCFDTALRLVKLGFLELTAPISIVAYIYSGDTLTSWVKEVLNTYVGLFVRIAALSFMIFGLHNLDNYMDSISTAHPWIVKIFIIIGLLMFVKEAPSLINKLFGVNIGTGKGGIKGKLAGMAGVGAVAANGWDKIKGAGKGALKTAGIGGATAIGAGAKGLGKAAGNGVNKLSGGKLSGGVDKIRQFGNKVGTSRIGMGAAALGAAGMAGIKSGGKDTSGAMKKAYDASGFAKEKADNKKNAKQEAIKSNVKSAINDPTSGGLNGANNYINENFSGNMAQAMRDETKAIYDNKTANKAVTTATNALKTAQSHAENMRNQYNESLHNQERYRSALNSIRTSDTIPPTMKDSLLNKISAGGMTSSDLYAQINSTGMDKAAVNEIMNDLGKMFDNSGNLMSDTKITSELSGIANAVNAANSDISAKQAALDSANSVLESSASALESATKARETVASYQNATVQSESKTVMDQIKK